MLLAMIAHGSWDGIPAIGGGSVFGFPVGIALGIVALVTVIVALRKTAPQEREFLRGILEPEVENGTIAAEELNALCAPKKQRKQFIRSGEGFKSHSNAKHVLRAALDLAHEVAEAGGSESEGVRHERAEIARLRERAAH